MRGKSIEMITVVLPLRKEQSKQKRLTSRKVSYSHRGRAPAGRKLGTRWKEDNSECICLDSVLSSPGSRIKEDTGADETHELSKEINSNEEVRGRNGLQK